MATTVSHSDGYTPTPSNSPSSSLEMDYPPPDFVRHCPAPPYTMDYLPPWPNDERKTEEEEEEDNKTSNLIGKHTMPASITKDDVKNVSTPDETKKTPFEQEYNNCLGHLLSFIPDVRNTELIRYLSYSDTNFTMPITKAYITEFEEHVDFVRKILRGIGKPSLYNWSKDSYYYFISNGKYRFNIKSRALDDELCRLRLEHRSTEPHHCEWEYAHDNDLNRNDILEMVTARCARNVTANKGEIDIDEITKPIPIFRTKNIEKNQMFMKLARMLKPHVENLYKKKITF